MLTFMQERQQLKLTKIEESLAKETNPRRIKYLKDKRVLLKNCRR